MFFLPQVMITQGKSGEGNIFSSWQETIFIPQQKGQLQSIVIAYNGLGLLENRLCYFINFRYNSLSCDFGRRWYWTEQSHPL